MLQSFNRLFTGGNKEGKNEEELKRLGNYFLEKMRATDDWRRWKIRRKNRKVIRDGKGG